ncbi:hypothetical protein MRX96_051359 [Rhipicephalus microplus]
MAASTPAALDAGRDDIDSMDFQLADARDLATLGDSNTSDTGSPRQLELDGDWQVLRAIFVIIFYLVTKW